MISQKIMIKGIEDIAVVDAEIDESVLKENECFIETKVSMISPGTELSRVFGLKKGAVYPSYPGYCSVGTIIAKHESLSQVNVGDRVLFSGPHASHLVYNYTTSDGGILYKLNSQTSPTEGAFLMMAWIAKNGILPVDVKLGDTVVVVGLGALGLILSIYYQQMGVDVIAMDPIANRCKLANKMGIKNTVDVKPSEQIEAINKLTNNKGADIVVDATGLSAAIETCVAIAAEFGQVVLLGSPRTSYTTDVTPTFNAIHTKMLNVIGALNRRYPFSKELGSRLSIERSMNYIEKLLNNKTIDVNDFISHTIAADQKEILKAYQGLMNDKENYTGVIIDWNKKV